MYEKPLYTRGSLSVVAALSVAFLLVVAGYQLSRPEAGGQEGVNAGIETVPTFSVPLPENDSDNDGLPDWQEALIGTDPDNPDSDGDGTPDAYALEYAGTSFARIRSSTTTAADEVSSRLLNEYTSIVETGAYTPDRGIRLGENLANNLYTETPFEPYTADEVETTNNTSYERVIEYRTDIQNAMEPLLSFNDAEFVLYGRFVAHRDRASLKELEQMGETYTSVARDIISIPIPVDALDEHLGIANGLAFYGAVLQNMVNYVDDPVASLALLKTYAEADQYVLSVFNTLSTYYREKYNERYDDER